VRSGNRSFCSTFVLRSGNGHNGTHDEDKIGERESWMQKQLISRRASDKVRVKRRARAAFCFPSRGSREDRTQDENLRLPWVFGRRPGFIVERSA
jgi:hypothetical protein